MLPIHDTTPDAPDPRFPALQPAEIVAAALGRPGEIEPARRLLADAARQPERSAESDCRMLEALGALGSQLLIDAGHDDDASRDPSLWDRERDGQYFARRAQRCRRLAGECIRAAEYLGWLWRFIAERGYRVRLRPSVESPRDYPTQTAIDAPAPDSLLAVLIDWSETACRECGETMTHEPVDRPCPSGDGSLRLAGHWCPKCGHDDRERLEGDAARRHRRDEAADLRRKDPTA